MTEKELSKYYKLEIEKKDLGKRIEKIETEIAVIKGGISAVQIKETVSSSHSSVSNQERLVELEESLSKLMSQLTEKRISAIEEYIKIEKYINDIDDPEIRTIARLRNIDLLSWNEIADEMSTTSKDVTEYSVKHKYYRFFKKNAK